MSSAKSHSKFYSLSCESIDGKHISLGKYRGKVLLVVNTASLCHFRAQLSDLQELYQRLSPIGLEILGFPCNQFMRQEHKNVYKINDCYQKKYQVDFQIFRKVKVNGNNTHPIFKHLKKRAPGVLSTSSIKWNFTKFLISHDGNRVKRFSPFSGMDILLDEVVHMLEDKLVADKQVSTEKESQHFNNLKLTLMGNGNAHAKQKILG